MPKKDPVQNVNPTTSNMPDLRQISNSVFNVGNVENDSFGSVSTLRNVTNFLGSISGFKKAILSEDFHTSPDTANSKSNESKTIGLTKPQRSTQTFQIFATSSMTALILAETTVLLLS